MSEADSDWYLRHRDGVQHGPFRLADIVSAAASGNVASDTAVRHVVHTRDQWVLAVRVQPIAQAMPSSTDGPESTPPAASAPAAAAPISPPATKPLSPLPRKRRAVRETPASPNPQGTSPKRSVFQRSGVQDDPVQNAPAKDDPVRGVPDQGSAIQRAATPTVSTASAQTPAPVAGNVSEATLDPVPAIRSLREHNFPVPKTFLDAAAALFDFRFRHFITPWIIKILWALAVAAAVLWLAKLGAEMFISPSLQTETALAPEASGGWQFEPLQGNSIFQTRIFLYGTATFVVGVLLLCARMALEAGIVFFYVASDIRELKKELKQRVQ